MTGPDPAAANAAQEAFWTTGPGKTWAIEHGRIDALIAPVTAALFARAAIAPGEAVLDVGCGTGETTLAAAARAGAAGRATGLDISPTLLAVARAQARAEGRTNVTFLRADAQIHSFGAAAFDVILSRHGVMFFADPVAAFGNLARALRPGGRAVFVTWAAPRLNPWVAEARAAAEARLGEVPADPPRAPGMFAFAERDYVAGILDEAGFVGVDARELRSEFHMDGRAEDAAAFAATIGPANYVIRMKGGTETDRAAIVRDLAARFRPFETPQGMRVPVVMNLFAARRA